MRLLPLATSYYRVIHDIDGLYAAIFVVKHLNVLADCGRKLERSKLCCGQKDFVARLSDAAVCGYGLGEMDAFSADFRSVLADESDDFNSTNLRHCVCPPFFFVHPLGALAPRGGRGVASPRMEPGGLPLVLISV